MNRDRGNNLTIALRWLARLGSLVSIGMLLLFIFGGEEPFRFPAANEIVGFCLFPVGIIVGMALGWRYELAGGGLTVLSLAGFYAWHFIAAGKFATGPFFLIFAAPGILFLLTAYLDRAGHKASSPS